MRSQLNLLKVSVEGIKIAVTNSKRNEKYFNFVNLPLILVLFSAGLEAVFESATRLKLSPTRPTTSKTIPKRTT